MPGVISTVRYDQHLLKPLGGRFVPTNWLFLDIESNISYDGQDQIHTFKLGWVCLVQRAYAGKSEQKTWNYFTVSGDLIKYLDRVAAHFGDVIFVGHNIFFDLQASGFFSLFTLWKWNLKFIYDKGLTYILKCTKKSNKVTVVSTTNWFDFSLERLGAALRFPKLTIDFEKATRAQLKRYCRRDVEILVVAMEMYLSFIRLHDLGKFSLTKASQAFTAYRHRFMQHKIYIHSVPDVTSLERDAYIGGRCECFYLGNVPRGPFVTLDVNSMYPFVMKYNEYPYKLVTYYESPSIEKIAELSGSYAVIAEIDVDTPEPVYAIHLDDKTVFPTGRFTCTVCSTGFKYALDHGHIVAINKASIYKRANLFSGYVDYFHSLRGEYKAAGNDIFLLLCKYMHNSLYGKFGQLKVVTDITDCVTGKDYIREIVPNLVTHKLVVITHLMNKQIVQYPGGEGDNSNVAIAAHITENGRFVLWDIISRVGRSKVLYCDTDSVKIRQKDSAPLKPFLSDHVLGGLKIEDTCKTLILEGAKNYRSDGRRKIKGIPKKADEISPGVFTYLSFGSQTLHLRKGQADGVRVKHITRRLTHVYRKGRVLPSGRIRPFILTP